eukprot:2691096-Rhodomonas_salina.1
MPKPRYLQRAFSTQCAAHEPKLLQAQLTVNFWRNAVTFRDFESGSLQARSKVTKRAPEKRRFGTNCTEETALDGGSEDPSLRDFCGGSIALLYSATLCALAYPAVCLRKCCAMCCTALAYGPTPSLRDVRYGAR